MIKYAFLLLIIFLAACSSYPVGYGPPLENPVAAVGEVQTATHRVRYGDVASKRIRDGVVRIHSEAVRLTVNGARFGDLYVWPGDEVTEGQLIARLDADHIRERYEAQVQRIATMRRLHSIVNEELALELDILELTYANAIWTAAEALDVDALDGTSLIRERIEWAALARRQALESQALELQAEELRLAELRHAMSETEIFSPMDGIVTHLATWPGRWINTLDPILYIACSRDPQIFVEYVGQVMNIFQARNAVRTYARLGEDIFDLEFIPPTPVQNLYYLRRGMNVPLRYNIVGGKLPPVGAAVAMHIYATLYENVLRIPYNAHFTGGAYGHLVYIIEGEQRVPTPITVGAVMHTYVAVLSGLREGDIIYVRP